MKASTYTFATVPLILFATGVFFAVHKTTARPGIGFPEMCMLIAVAFSGCGILVGIRCITQARQKQEGGVFGLIAATCLAAFPLLIMIASLCIVAVRGFLMP